MTEQTTPLDTAARQEAERRYGHPDADYEDRIENTAARDAFEAGARWGVEQADAEVRRLTAALAEAYEARDIAQGQWRWYQARAERAEAVLAEVAALHTNVYHRKMYAEFWACGECDYPATGPDDYCPTATLARADEEADR